MINDRLLRRNPVAEFHPFDRHAYHVDRRAYRVGQHAYHLDRHTYHGISRGRKRYSTRL